jgi:hypothetical protein
MKTIDDSHHPDYPIAARKIASEIGRRLDAALPKGQWGYALLLFQFGEGGTMGYISNAKREDMIKALREQANYLEGKRT